MAGDWLIRRSDDVILEPYPDGMLPLGCVLSLLDSVGSVYLMVTLFRGCNAIPVTVTADEAHEALFSALEPRDHLQLIFAELDAEDDSLYIGLDPGEDWAFLKEIRA